MSIEGAVQRTRSVVLGHCHKESLALAIYIVPHKARGHGSGDQEKVPRTLSDSKARPLSALLGSSAVQFEEYPLRRVPSSQVARASVARKPPMVQLSMRPDLGRRRCGGSSLSGSFQA